MEVNPRNHLRNGHLHNMISAPVSRNEHHGDGIETQSSPESVMTISLSTESPPGPRRLRLPCFKLNCEIAKFKNRGQQLDPRRTAGFFETTRSLPVCPGQEPREFREFDALRGRRGRVARQRGCLNNIRPSVSTLVLKILQRKSSSPKNICFSGG